MEHPAPNAIPAEVSERITLLRFPLVAAVVFLHAYDPNVDKHLFLQYDGITKFVCNYISEGLATVSVPLFFLIAGYLFFWRDSESPDFRSKSLWQRVGGLAIPMIFWNALCLAVFAVAQAVPATAKFMGGRSVPVGTLGVLGYLNAVVGITTHPIAYQFWFIRDLILLIVLSPVIKFAIKNLPVPFLAGIGAWWWLATPWALPVLSREAVLFFSLGALFGLRRTDLRALDHHLQWFFAFFLPLSVLDAITKQQPFGNSIHKAAEICGVITIWCITREVRRFAAFKAWLTSLSPASFFVFACHEPLLTVIRKLSFRAVPVVNDVVVLTLYFFDPILVILLCVAGYFLCIRTVPNLTSVVTGGRSRRIAIAPVSTAQA